MAKKSTGPYVVETRKRFHMPNSAKSSGQAPSNKDTAIKQKEAGVPFPNSGSQSSCKTPRSQKQGTPLQQVGYRVSFPFFPRQTKYRIGQCQLFDETVLLLI